MMNGKQMLGENIQSKMNKYKIKIKINWKLGWKRNFSDSKWNKLIFKKWPWTISIEKILKHFYVEKLSKADSVIFFFLFTK